MQRPKVTCLLEVCFRNSSLDIAWDKHVWPKKGEVTFRLTWVTFGLGEKPSTKRDLRHQDMSFGRKLGYVTFVVYLGHVWCKEQVTYKCLGSRLEVYKSDGGSLAWSRLDGGRSWQVTFRSAKRDFTSFLCMVTFGPLSLLNSCLDLGLHNHEIGQETSQNLFPHIAHA
ncbi:hypothetical protein PIB30_102120 [Stylosanthes scabra]|uniref:Uncharacterized protein n=1 Tax=Stylosanthes scabra TaxID=79078 RepID=A0ABU6SZZ5_9FABA|nr:hypothetical protein [Stylosanthes scabra]